MTYRYRYSRWIPLLLAIGFTSLFSLAAPSTAVGESAHPRTNVLYISMEDIGPFTGYHGILPVRTPHLDRLAAQSMTFMDAHCQVALCTPSRTSILTGIRPSTSGIVRIDDNWQEMLPGAVSLPKHFRNHGYHTRAVGKIYDSRCGGMDDAFDQEQTDRILTNDLPLQALRETAALDATPFFLAIGYAQAHTEWTPTAWALEQYRDVPIDPSHYGSEYKGKRMNPEQVTAFIRSYFAFITDVDRLIGQLIHEAEALGLLDNTVVIIGSMDHGYSLGWQGKYGKGNNHDMETQVPLLIRLPDPSFTPRRIPSVVELVDIYPTLLELCHLPNPPQALEGLSLVPLMQNPDAPWKTAAFTHRAYHLQDVAVKTSDFTLIARMGIPPQLFDRHRDPFHRSNIAAEHPNTVAELSALLQSGWKLAQPPLP